MATARTKSKANPALLKWARERARLDVATAAKRATVSADSINAWEAGTDAPSIPQLRKLGEVYKRPIVVFFLDVPPKDFEALKDFRRLPAGAADESPELAAEIRWAHEMRDVAVEAMTLADDSIAAFDVTANLVDDPLQVAKTLRNRLAIKTDDVTACRDHYAAYRLWRDGLDQLGVLSFQISRVDVGEARGFSINLRPLPVVAVNASDAVSARIFTLLHETAHLVLGDAGTCDLHEAGGKTRDQIEVWCNAVAGEVLVPRSDLKSEPNVRTVRQAVEWDEPTIRALANRYRVSREVIIRRFMDLGLATQAFYQRKRAEYAREQRGGAEGGGDYYNNLRSKYGMPVIRAVLSAYEAGKLTANEAAAYLRVKVESLAKLVPS